MKRIIILLCAVISGVFLNAQSLTVTGDNSVLTSDPCLTTHAYLDIKNIDNKEHEILCEKNVIIEPDGMSNYFCWGGNCYGSSTLVSTSSLTLQPGQADAVSFGGYFDAFCAQGAATVEYCFYPVDDPNDKTCTMITYHGPATNIIDNKVDVWMSDFFPNPATNYIEFNYDGNNMVLKILDVLGAEVKNIDLIDSGSQQIYVGDLTQGIYFGRLIKNEESIAIKKFIIK
tara:strand:- start:59 stop:745 length:687 start_codon:yes stop_codon:yes gene_type:complete